MPFVEHDHRETGVTETEPKTKRNIKDFQVWLQFLVMKQHGQPSSRSTEFKQLTNSHNYSPPTQVCVLSNT